MDPVIKIRLTLLFFLVFIPTAIFLILRRSKLSIRIIVTLILFLFAAIAVPNFISPRMTIAQNACVNNMRQIQGAKEAWALENKKSQSDEPTEADLKKYLKNGVIPTCPMDGRSYRFGNVSELPVCPNSKERGHVLESAKN